MPKVHQGYSAPKTTLNTDLNYEQMSSAAAKVLLNTQIWSFSFFCSEQQTLGPIALALTERQIAVIKRRLLLTPLTGIGNNIKFSHIGQLVLSYNNTQPQLTRPLHAVTSCQCILSYLIPQGSSSAQLEVHTCIQPFHRVTACTTCTIMSDSRYSQSTQNVK